MRCCSRLFAITNKDRSVEHPDHREPVNGVNTSRTIREPKHSQTETRRLQVPRLYGSLASGAGSNAGTDLVIIAVSQGASSQGRRSAA